MLVEAPGHVGRDGQPINTVYELLRDDPWHWLRLDDLGYVSYGGMLGELIVAGYLSSGIGAAKNMKAFSK